MNAVFTSLWHFLGQAIFYISLCTFAGVLQIADGRSKHSLKCYTCDSLIDGDRCHTKSNANESALSYLKTDCSSKDEKYCMVRRYSYSPNGTDTKLWIIERRCAAICANECIITGDRMKLHLCTSCCTAHYCNIGNGAGLSIGNLFVHMISMLSMFHLS